MELNWQEMLFEFFGGLGIFLFAIKYMGDGLQKAAGDRLRDIIRSIYNKSFYGCVSWYYRDVLIQSSSGTTVITVGLVSAGFMTFATSYWCNYGSQYWNNCYSFYHWI